MKTNRRVRNKVGGGGLSEKDLIAAVIVLVAVFVAVIDGYHGGKEKTAEADRRVEIRKEIQWLKTRVANLEGYAAHLEAEIKGLEFFDVVFTGDQAEAMRPLYDAAVDAEFERIRKCGGLSYGTNE